MKVGVVDLSVSGWAAGSVVSRTMAKSLVMAGGNVIFFASSETDPMPCGVYQLYPPKYLPGECTFRKILRLPHRESIVPAVRSAGVDVLLPMVKPMHGIRAAQVGWIPDFQHHHLPDLFTLSQRQELDRRFVSLALSSNRMLLSSEDAARDFRAFYATQAERAAVASFPSAFAFDPPTEKVGYIFEKYHLPEKFALVVNQFWRHKNHRLVIDALGMLNRQGLQIPLVMIGQLSDYRDRQNQGVSDLLQFAATNGIWSNCKLLGRVSRGDLADFLRCATLFIQPSLFEGWNTSIQDAKALGLPIMASSLAVHREQLGSEGCFFDPHNSLSLAEVLADLWARLDVRPDLIKEKSALEKEKAFARIYGEKLMEICREACA